MTQRTCIWLVGLLALAITAAGASSFPSLWSATSPHLQQALDSALNEEFGRPFWKNAGGHDFGLALVDTTDLRQPKVAERHGDRMMYAASLPKIAILLGAFVEVERGNLQLDQRLQNRLARMIRHSSNTAATRVLQQVGPANLAEILQSPRFRLYDPAHNGGLWVGQAYADGPAWRRDPLHGISHGATAMQAARLYS